MVLEEVASTVSPEGLGAARRIRVSPDVTKQGLTVLAVLDVTTARPEDARSTGAEHSHVSIGSELRFGKSIAIHLMDQFAS